MRVKIGARWHEVASDNALCVELTEADRRNIAAMAPNATKYAVFSEDDARTSAEKLEWMEG